jgi:hypothetical protein
VELFCSIAGIAAYGQIVAFGTIDPSQRLLGSIDPNAPQSRVVDCRVTGCPTVLKGREKAVCLGKQQPFVTNR